MAYNPGKKVLDFYISESCSNLGVLTSDSSLQGECAHGFAPISMKFGYVLENRKLRDP